MASANGTSLGALPFGFASSLTSTTLNASGIKVGALHRAQKTGNISAIGFQQSRSGTSPVFEGRVETVTSGLPSGTIHTASASVTFSDATGGATWYKKTLGANCAVTKDDLIAAVIQYSSGTINGSNQIFVSRNGNNGGGINACLLPCALSHNGTSWSQTQLPPAVALYYDDGEILLGGFYTYAITGIAFQVGSTPDEYANSFVAPAGMSCDGMDAWVGFGNTSATAIATLYDSGGSALATSTVLGTIGASFGKIRFAWTPVTLTSGATYTISIKSGTANNLTVYRYDWFSTVERNASHGVITGRSRTDAGTWTDTSLSTYSIAATFSSITAGGIMRTGMNGGLL